MMGPAGCFLLAPLARLNNDSIGSSGNKNNDVQRKKSLINLGMKLECLKTLGVGLRFGQ